jgi:acyl-CoA synthetase (AMP-forming)/AMP-acid ligase II
MWDTLVEPPFAGESDTLPKQLSKAVSSKPFGEAVAAVGVEEEYAWDYPTLEHLTRGCAAGLIGMGHKHGSRFATWMSNGPEAVSSNWVPSLVP